MNIREIYEAAFDRYLEARRQAWDSMCDDGSIPKDEALSFKSADITAELVGRAAGPACVAADIPF
jgi:hypothetical protein